MYVNITYTFGSSIWHTTVIFAIAFAAVLFSFALMASMALKISDPRL